MTSKVEMYRIYISGLGPDVQSDDLKVEFEDFGRIYHFQFHADLGYALISYTKQASAILAIANGSKWIIKDYPIQVQWARGWPKNRVNYKDFDSVLNESNQNNYTVHCCNLSNRTTINVVKSMFSLFGNIQEIYTKNSCTDVLVRFIRKVDATLAICTIDDTEVDGKAVCCEWSNIPIPQLAVSGWQRTRFVNQGYQAPALPAGLPSSTNTSFRTPRAVSSVLINKPSNSTLKIDTVTSNQPRNSVESSTTDGTPATSELASLNSNVSEIRILFSDSGNFQSQVAQDFKEPNPALTLPPHCTVTSKSRSDNITSSTPKETYSISEISSVLSNEQYTNDDFDTVFNKAKLNNCTVCCEGLSLNTTNESLKKIFSPFGTIEEIDLYAGRTDYALIRFNTKVAAALAICAINNTEINGCRVKCTWSNRSTDQNHQAQENDTPLVVAPVAGDSPLGKPLPQNPELLQHQTKQDEPECEEKKNEITFEMLCKICEEEKLGVVFVPCGHLTACVKCAEQISTCPLCRGLIASKVRTYFG